MTLLLLKNLIYKFPAVILTIHCILQSCSGGTVNECENIGPISPYFTEKVEHSQGFAYREPMPQLTARRDIVRQIRSHQDQRHEVTFVIRQRNMEQLTDILHDISNPLSPNYGQHMTGEEVAAMTSNPDARDAVVIYLLTKGAIIVFETLHGEYVKASAPIDTWERMFNTEFFTFHQSHSDIKVDKVTRAERYWIPLELDQHVESVFNTIQMPTRVVGSLPILQPLAAESEKVTLAIKTFPGYVTPEKLKAAYNVGTNKGSSSSTQAVFSTIDQYFSPADLAFFQSVTGLPNQPAAGAPYGHSSDSKCVEDQSNCVEGNLDIQYMMATSPGSPTSYWYTDLSLTDWLVTVANTVKPPLVFSISYGADELSMSASELTAFSTQAIKLSSMGVSLVAASGDDGAVNRGRIQYGVDSCAYAPFFPASSPYVTSVGATSGVESGTPEVACQSDLGNQITTGGGFSYFFDQPSFQKPHTAMFFAHAAAAGNTPYAGYNGLGRGFPDISLAGAKYLVRIGGEYSSVSGTSASAPAVGGFISNINAARMAAGKGSVGWINPTLYANHSAFVNDIVSGDNHCAADGLCCPHGYETTPGWDPVTGLGTVDYGKMQSLFVSLGSSVNGAQYIPSAAPTYGAKPIVAVPSFRPSSKTPVSNAPYNPPTPRPSTNPPTATPTVAYFTSLQASQVIEGISVAQASDPSFTAALVTSVSSAMKVPRSAVMGVRVSEGRRQLLSGVTTAYTVETSSGMTSDTLIANLRSSVDGGSFLTSLKATSGLPITGVSGLIVVQVTPTTSPSPTSGSLKGMNLTIILAAVGTGVGIVLIIIAAMIFCYCCRKTVLNAPTAPLTSEVGTGTGGHVVPTIVYSTSRPIVQRPVLAPESSNGELQVAYAYPAISPAARNRGSSFAMYP